MPELFGVPKAEKLRGDDRAEALPIFYWAPKHRLDRPEENFRGKPDRA